MFAERSSGVNQSEALKRENESLKTEVKRLQDQVRSLHSATESVTAAPAERLVSEERGGSFPSSQLAPYATSGLGPSTTDRRTAQPTLLYMSAEYELWSRHATVYPPLFSFKQPQVVAEALLGSKSSHVDRRAW